jgi:FMN phosphatase YigB (HAD superfamily)
MPAFPAPGFRTGLQPEARTIPGTLIRAIALDYGGALTLDAIDHLLGEKPVDPAAAGALRTLHQYGIALLVASDTTPGEKRWPALQKAGIDGLFRVALLSYSLGVRKPAPLFYELVLAAAGCPASEVLFVGDNFACDVAGPVAHGMQAVLVRPRGLRPGEELPDGVPLIGHIRELPALLDAR